MNIVVTGGAGFIGSHLIDRLLKEGHNVTNVDNFDPFYDESIKRKNIKGHLEYDSYTLHEVDIRDKEALDKSIPDDTNVIVHLAAKAGVRPSIADPIAYQEVNVAGTQNMLEVAREKDIKQFVFASSSSVYGPRQRPDLAIHKFLKLMSQGKEITLYGDGSTRRDYTYIDDIINGVMAAIDYRDSLYEIINLGNNQTVELLELVEAIEKASGITAKKTFGPEQPGDVKQTWADVNKASQLLNYKSDFSIDKGLLVFSDWIENKKVFVK